LGARFVYGIAHDNNLDDIPDTFGSGIKSTRLYGKLNRLAISSADAVIAQNAYQYSRAQQRLDTDVHKITNCYEPGSPEPIPELSESESLVVLWVSRFTDFKRPDLAIEIAEACPNIEFVLIGTESDPKLFEQARSRAARLDNVRFEGFVPFAEIDRYFCSADLFLNTSRQEGFPNTFLQSWAYKKPVVSLTVDPDDVISEHGVGWVLSDSVQEAVNLLDQLADDPEYRDEVGERAYRYFRDTHSINAIVDKYEQVFTDSGTESP
jgi:glycosyltransferase involved in cell wall biosynthesis